MMKITQDMDYEGANEPVKKLVDALRDYHKINAFRNGIDKLISSHKSRLKCAGSRADTIEINIFAALKHPVSSSHGIFNHLG